MIDFCFQKNESINKILNLYTKKKKNFTYYHIFICLLFFFFLDYNFNKITFLKIVFIKI